MPLMRRSLEIETLSSIGKNEKYHFVKAGKEFRMNANQSKEDPSSLQASIQAKHMVSTYAKVALFSKARAYKC